MNDVRSTAPRRAAKLAERREDGTIGRQARLACGRARSRPRLRSRTIAQRDANKSGFDDRGNGRYCATDFHVIRGVSSRQ
jgi:hypothetical protein